MATTEALKQQNTQNYIDLTKIGANLNEYEKALTKPRIALTKPRIEGGPGGSGKGTTTTVSEDGNDVLYSATSAGVDLTTLAAQVGVDKSGYSKLLPVRAQQLLGSDLWVDGKLSDKWVNIVVSKYGVPENIARAADITNFQDIKGMKDDKEVHPFGVEMASAMGVVGLGDATKKNISSGSGASVDIGGTAVSASSEKLTNNKLLWIDAIIKSGKDNNRTLPKQYIKGGASELPTKVLQEVQLLIENNQTAINGRRDKSLDEAYIAASQKTADSESRIKPFTIEKSTVTAERTVEKKYPGQANYDELPLPEAKRKFREEFPDKTEFWYKDQRHTAKFDNELNPEESKRIKEGVIKVNPEKSGDVKTVTQEVTNTKLEAVQYNSK